MRGLEHLSSPSSIPSPQVQNPHPPRTMLGPKENGASRIGLFIPNIERGSGGKGGVPSSFVQDCLSWMTSQIWNKDGVFYSFSQAGNDWGPDYCTWRNSTSKEITMHNNHYELGALLQNFTVKAKHRVVFYGRSAHCVSQRQQFAWRLKNIVLAKGGIYRV